MSDTIAQRSTSSRILVIDDDASLRRGMARVLLSAGYDVIEAENGTEGLRVAQLYAPEIIVSHVNLPDINGMHLSQQIKALPACAESRVALISGQSISAEEITDGLEAGADEYIIRPLSHREFLARIQLLIRLKQMDERSKHALRDSEDRFRAAMDMSLEAFTILRSIRDDQGQIIDFQWTYANSAAGRILQQPPDQLVDQRLLEILPGNRENRALFDRYARIVETGQGDEVELRYQSEGIDGWFRNMTVKLGDGIAISFSDITQQKQAEAILRQHKEDLERLVAERTAELESVNQRLQQELTERKQVAEALRESEARYRELFETSRDGIVISDMQGRYIECNNAYLDLLGYDTFDELRLRSYEEVTPPEYHEFEKTVIAEQTIARGYCDEYEKECIRKNGERISVTARAWLRRDGDNQPYGMWVIVHDITDRKRAEDALRESEARWQFALEGAGDGVWDWNAQTNTVYFSPQWKRMFGFQPHEIGNSLFEWEERVHPDDRERVYAAIHEHFDGKTPVYMSEHRVRCKDGAYKWMLDRGKIIQWTAEGKPLRVIGTHTDITARKQVEQTLQESETRLRRLVENIPDILYVFSSTRGGIYYSPHLETILGYAPERLYQNPKLWNQSIHPDDMPRVVEAIEQFHQGRPFKIEYRIKDAAGEWRWLYDRSIGRRDLPGETLIEGLALDITDLKRAREVAEAASRVKSEFLATMSHEIRTPMNAILGFTDLLERLTTDAKQRSYLKAIQMSGTMLLTLINDILDLSKLEAGKMTCQAEPVSLRRLFEEIRQIFSLRAAQKHLMLRASIDASLPEALLLDEIRLRQVLFNLVGNAVKFTENGSVTISARTRGIMNDETLDLALSVEDTGIGIPPEDQQQIFEAFRQRPGQRAQQFGGTGLGLAISKRLVTMMGGTLSVWSVQGQGSVFEARFPQIQIPPSDRLPLNVPPPDSPLSHWHGVKSVADDHGSTPLVHHALLAELPPETLNALPDILTELQNTLFPQWERLQAIQPIQAVKQFVGDLHALGERYQFAMAREYANALDTALECFDIRAMRKILREFPVMLMELKSLEGERE